MEKRPLTPAQARELAEHMGFRWADGEIHETLPPRDEDLIIPSEGQRPEQPPIPKVSIQERTDVPVDWLPTPRYQLRITALDFVLRLMALQQHKVATGPEAMQQAEFLERWLTNQPLKGEKDAL